MCLSIIDPELPLTYAAGQWSQAKQSVVAFKSSGYDDWHLRQALFDDRGGFILHPQNGGAFPTNAAQLH
jgi:hypothetical protein